MRRACPALMCLLLSAALSLWSAAPAHAESASLVVDLETSARGDGSSPHRFLADRGKVFFLARERSIGEEVWVSDGTANGTEPLIDACPGPCGSQVTFLGAAHGFVFWVDTGNDRLWSSDGTAAHTGPLSGTDATIQILETEDIAFAGDFLYFPACTDSPVICGLWRSDGTVAGTQAVPGTQSLDTSPRELVAIGNKVYFAARSTWETGELWVTDGTSRGTQVVRSFSPGIMMPRLLTAAGGKLFFVTGLNPEGQSDEELWVSDGTAAGTRMVSRFDAHRPFASTHWLKAAGSQVYFFADDVTHGVEIWRSDGTEAGAVRITDFGLENPFGEHLTADDLALAGDRLVFRARDGLTGTDLWATSGAPESTVALADLCAGSCHQFTDYSLLSVGSRVLFVADDDQHGREAWGTDGTPAGTAMLGDLCPGPCDAIQDIPRADRRQLFGDGFFVAAETQPDFHEPERVRLNLWKSDGTVAETRRWTDFTVDTALSSSDFPAAVPLGGNLLFAASVVGEDGLELWASNGRPGGTRQIADLDRARDGAAPRSLTVWGDRLAFSGCAGARCRVWRTSGTAESTRPVEGDAGTSGDGLAVAGGALFFWQAGSSNDLELWRTDDTAAGSRRLLVVGYPDRVFPLQLTALGNRVFFQVFRGYSPDVRQEIWQSDGTVQGTRMVLLLPEGWKWPERLVAAGDAVYFVLNDGQKGQLWRTDGTPAGTGVVFSLDEYFWLLCVGSDARLYFETLGGNVTLWRTDGTTAGTVPLTTTSVVGDGIVQAIEWRDVLYFVKPDGYGTSLWRTDGTAAGTVMVQVFRNDARVAAAEFVPLGDALYFAVDDGVHGRELWKTDGTTAGTVLVRDVFPGTAGSGLHDLTVAAGSLYFSAADGIHGFELWKSDGTAAGTRLVQDIAPGALSSGPAELQQVGERLYFSADDGLTGSELWALPLATGPGCVASPTRLCLSGGRFAVEAAWKAQGSSGTGMAVPLTADTGYFWFFGPDNVEVVLKVLDARGVNGHHWVFYGALSDVEYTLTVTDTQSGAAVRYSNLPGRLASVADTEAFGPLGAFGSKSIERAAAASALTPLALAAERVDPKAATGTCQESASRLCLNGGRFAVEASWKAQGQNGTGRGVKLTGDTGYFWFFDAGNVEVILKVLDGTGVNGKTWVFYGALSDVEYTLTVTDTQTGKVRTYANPAGRLASLADTGAF